jgi:hypothetical protein
MAAAQQGMKMGGYRGNIPNPQAEGAAVSLHRNLARYMGTGAPRPSTDSHPLWWSVRRSCGGQGRRTCVRRDRPMNPWERHF